MDHLLTRHGLRLTYLRGSNIIDELDQELILDDLFEGALPGEVPLCSTRSFLSDYDHLVLAADTTTNQFLGLLGARNGDTGRESYLLLETGFVVAEARGHNLLRRMIALILLRIGGLGNLPASIATVTRNPRACQALRGLGSRLQGTKFCPEPDEAVTLLASVAMLQRIGANVGRSLNYHTTVQALATIDQDHRSAGALRLAPQAESLVAEPMLVALDLRGAEEARLLTDARRLYRSKSPGVRAPDPTAPQRASQRSTRVVEPSTTATS
jgi:hypothetical protein